MMSEYCWGPVNVRDVCAKTCGVCSDTVEDVCEDDLEAVRKAMFDPNADCPWAIGLYKKYNTDLCADDSEFKPKCCATCKKMKAAQTEEAVGVCEDDLAAVREATFDPNADCPWAIRQYKKYNIDLCADDSEFKPKCCATCKKIKAAQSEKAVGVCEDDLAAVREATFD